MASAPFQRGMASETSDVRDLLDLTPEDIAESEKARRGFVARYKNAGGVWDSFPPPPN